MTGPGVPRAVQARAAEALKKAAGEAAAREVRDGMVVGLGTGSTVRYTVLELARRVREEGLDLVGVPTSRATERLARESGVRLTDLDAHPDLDLTIDGADELDGRLQLIKGGGGALTREKIVARASASLVVVADASKRVEVLGGSFPLPVEVLEFGKTPALRFLESLGAQAALRRAPDGSLFRTDNGNLVADARFAAIADPEGLERDLDLHPAIVECGLFLGMCRAAYVAGSDGVERLEPVP